MVFLNSFLTLLAPTLVLSLSQNSTSKIQWGPCNTTEVGNITAPLTADCANFLVPLDYTTPLSNSTKLTLQLARIPASIQPSLGSILLNFGGPGGTGRDSLISLANILHTLSGGRYDLIAFDPRGTGNTIPFTCIQTDLEAFTFASELTLGNVSDVAYGRLWAQGQVIASLCSERQKATGEFVGTAFVARDLISVVDALDEDGMLRYWGFSYGTTLGATVASMFPERIDKMIIDGVQNPHEYYHAPVDYEEWSMSDAVFTGIFTTCLEPPTTCALSTLNLTAPALEAAVYTLLTTLRSRPIALENAILDYLTLKSFIVSSLYATSSWPTLAAVLTLLLSGNISELSKPGVLGSAAADPLTTLVAGVQTANSLMGIHCGDRDVRTSTLDAFLPALQKLERTSKLMGDVTTAVSMTCTQWKFAAKERYMGDFHVKTKNPVLVVGNTYDGLTPITSARNVSAGLEGSVVLEINGYGHCSLPLPSACTLRHVSAYWATGKLPAVGTVCEVDAKPYSAVTWSDVFANATGNGTAAAFAKRTDGRTEVGSLEKWAKMR